MREEPTLGPYSQLIQGQKNTQIKEVVTYVLGRVSGLEIFSERERKHSATFLSVR